MKPTVWSVKKGSGKRFALGHPWIFSGELAVSPKGLAPGAPVELRSPKGDFLAYGYGNPHSLISFRALTRNGKEVDFYSREFVVRRLAGAAVMRERLGRAEVSHRLCFAEGDFLPGLIVDRFFTADGAQIFVAQVLTAGMEKLIGDGIEVFEKFIAWERERRPQMPQWERTAVVLKNDSKIRTLEGLQPEPARVIKEVSGLNLSQVEVMVAAALGSDPLKFTVDFVSGQKTGFFLDQAANISLAARYLPTASKTGELKVLDLFCYVGQWGAQLSRRAKDLGLNCKVDLVDASESALALAHKNVKAAGGEAHYQRLDIVEGLPEIAADYDVVVCDPPAFIKARKDIEAGVRAYAKVFQMAMAKVRAGGLFMACSCSHHLSEEDFARVLSEATARAGREIQWLGRGGQAPDHPILLGFPEGQYLKAWLGIVRR